MDKSGGGGGGGSGGGSGRIGNKVPLREDWIKLLVEKSFDSY